MSTVKERPETLVGKTYRVKTGLGKLYVTINEIDGEPFEVFATIGKSGGSITAKAEVTGRLVSLALRHGVPLKEIIEQLTEISGQYPLAVGKEVIKSIPDAVGKLLRRLYGEKLYNASWSAAIPTTSLKEGTNILETARSIDHKSFQNS
jgi:ribonucleoside-diphosphate reductase alpha chain